MGINDNIYSAKEWMPAFGLNLYDFSARQYDPILCRFTSPDPLNFNYPHLSPYLYCAANPINYSDPTGLAAIYNSSGEHIGNTKEGFTGQIYIYDGSEKIDFSKYYEYQLSELDLNIRRLDDVATLLSTNAKLAIWNHIIAHFVGTYFGGERFSLDRINGGRIRYHYSPIGKNNQTTMWGAEFERNGTITYPPIIVWSNDFFSEYEGTIENIASTILVHEWYSHGIMHIGEENHEKAYENVLKYRSLWENTTIKYRYFVLNKMHEFKPLERKYKLTETLYINLIYKYGK